MQQQISHIPINYNLEKVYTSTKRCYGETIQHELPSLDDLFKQESDTKENVFIKSLRLRIAALDELREVRDGKLKLNIRKVWRAISESIQILPVEAVISSIGSQGFLSIPLFKYDDDKENFEFIRLHIWDDTLNKYVNEETSKKFSIHTHAFNAESWVLCGQIVNDRYLVQQTSCETPFSLFTIGYNSSVSKINQHTSIAENNEQYVTPIQISHEVYMQNGNYSIKAGEFHRSGTNEIGDISATLFSFTADVDFNNPSYVVGPSDIPFSEINRKELIDPIALIKRIDKKIGLDE